MKRWGKTSTGRPQWRIGTEDLSDVLFPPNDRICTLFKRHTGGQRTSVIVRQGNSIVIETGPGITQHDCEAFLRALWDETHFT